MNIFSVIIETIMNVFSVKTAKKNNNKQQILPYLQNSDDLPNISRSFEVADVYAKGDVCTKGDICRRQYKRYKNVIVEPENLYFVYVLQNRIIHSCPNGQPQSFDSMKQAFLTGANIDIPSDSGDYSTGEDWENLVQQDGIENYDDFEREYNKNQPPPTPLSPVIGEGEKEPKSNEEKTQSGNGSVAQKIKRFISVLICLFNMSFVICWVHVLTNNVSTAGTEEICDIRNKKFQFGSPPYGPTFVEFKNHPQISILKNGNIINYEVHAISSRPVSWQEYQYIIFEKGFSGNPKSGQVSHEKNLPDHAWDFCKRVQDIWKYEKYTSFDRAYSSDGIFRYGILIPVYKNDVASDNHMLYEILHRAKETSDTPEMFWLAFVRTR